MFVGTGLASVARVGTGRAKRGLRVTAGRRMGAAMVTP